MCRIRQNIEIGAKKPPPAGGGGGGGRPPPPLAAHHHPPPPPPPWRQEDATVKSQINSSKNARKRKETTLSNLGDNRKTC
jgi:hypothetical protein